MTLLLTLNRPQTPQLATISTPALSSAPKKPGGNAARDRAIKAQKAQEKRSAAATAAKPVVANHGPSSLEHTVVTSTTADATYEWFLYKGEESYRQATKIYHLTLSNTVESLAGWLAERLRGQDREALLLTATFPSAADPLDSFHRCQEFLDLLLTEGPSSGLDLLLSTQELHRVEKGLAAPEAAPSRRKVSIEEKTFAEFMRADAEAAADPSLRGHGHLHALLVADQSFRSHLYKLVEDRQLPIDLSLVIVGGQRPRADAPTGRYALHLRRALRYVVKEYRIDQKENLDQWLSRILSRRTTKFLLAYDRDGIGRELSFSSWEGQLLRTIGPLAIQRYSSQRPFLLAKNSMVSILNLLEYYLETTGHRLLVQKYANPTTFNYALAVPRSGQPGSPVDLLEHTSSGLYTQLLAFYSERDLASAEMLASAERLFATLARTGALAVRPHLRPEPVSGALALEDGLTLKWDLSRGCLRLLDQHQMVQETLPAPTGFHLSGGLKAGWYEMQALLSAGEALRQLRRLVYDPSLNQSANEYRLLRLVQTLGHLFLKTDRRDLSGLFFWGPPGIGKTPFIGELVEAFWPRSSAPVKLTERFGLSEAADKEVILLGDVERFRKGSQQVAHLKKLMSPTPVLVDFKNKAHRQVDFSSKVFIMDSNYSLQEIFGEEYEPLSKRFPLQLQLLNYPCSPTHPLGYTPALLRAEMGQVVLIAVALATYSLPFGPYTAGGGEEGWEKGRDWQSVLLDLILRDNPQASFSWLERWFGAEEIQQVLEKSLTVLFQEHHAQLIPNSWAPTPTLPLPSSPSETHLVYPTNAQWLAAAYGT